jgi:hypothetical protein
MMDEIEDCKTYVAEYFSWKVPWYREAVFTIQTGRPANLTL